MQHIRAENLDFQASKSVKVKEKVKFTPTFNFMYPESKKLPPQKTEAQKVKEGYLTPMQTKIQPRCSNHFYLKSEYYVETSNNEKIYYCQKCSKLIANQGFKVVKYVSKLGPRVFQNNKSGACGRFSKGSTDTGHSQFIKNLENSLRVDDLSLQQYNRKIDLSLGEVEAKAQQLLEELAQKFQAIFQLINREKASCISLIIDKADSLKSPLENFKKEINSERWAINKIESQINLLSSIRPFQTGNRSQNFEDLNIFEKIQSKVQQISSNTKSFQDKASMLLRTAKPIEIVCLGSVESIMSATCEKVKSSSQNSTKFCSQKSFRQTDSAPSLEYEVQESVCCPSSIHSKAEITHQPSQSLLDDVNSLEIKEGPTQFYRGIKEEAKSSGISGFLFQV